MDNHDLTRRDFQKLAAAALSGAVLGASGTSARAADKKEERKGFLGEPHICRGLNTCKGLDKAKKNECAGQGVCASAAAHACHAHNQCKGQGGCGEHPGDNACKAMGACNVPLDDKTWLKARRRFEELMTKEDKKFGAAPAKK